MSNTGPSRISRLRFLRDWRFWLNYLLVLIVTCWLPMLSQNKRLTTKEGAIVHEETLSVRAYQSWHVLFTEGAGAGHGQAVVTHLLLSFTVVFVVWLLMFRPPQVKTVYTGCDSPQS